MELSGHLDFAVVLQKKKKRISNREKKKKKKIERGGKEVRGVPSARGKRELRRETAREAKSCGGG